MTSTSVQPRDASGTPGISVQTNQERKAFDLRLPPLSLCTVRPTHTHGTLSSVHTHRILPQSHLMCPRLKFHFTSGLLSILPSLFTGCPIPPAPPFTTQPHAQQTHTPHPICSFPHLFFHLLTHAPLPHFCPILNPSIIVYLAVCACVFVFVCVFVQGRETEPEKQRQQKQDYCSQMRGIIETFITE